MKIYLALIFLLLSVPLLANQPPYEVDDPAVTENFREIYLRVDQHKHAGDDDSSRMFDVIPDTSVAYDLGHSSRQWSNAYIATGTFSGALQISTYTTTQLNSWSPPRVGILLLNMTDFDLHVSTGVARSAWKNVRTGAGP